MGTTNARGIIPDNKYNRYNFTVRNTTKFLDDKLTLDFSLSYVNRNDRNLMAQGQYFNPLVPLYLFPRGESFDAIRTFEVRDASRGIYVQNWNFGDALRMQNPYWVAKRMNRINHKHRYMTNASLKYQITPWLDVTGRLRFDRTNTKFEDQRYASTINLFAHSPYGFYKYENVADQALYGDLMANINKTLGDFSIGANIGGSFQRTQYEDEGYQGRPQRLRPTSSPPTPSTMRLPPTTTAPSMASTSTTSTPSSPMPSWAGRACSSSPSRAATTGTLPSPARSTSRSSIRR